MSEDLVNVSPQGGCLLENNMKPEVFLHTLSALPKVFFLSTRFLMGKFSMGNILILCFVCWVGGSDCCSLDLSLFKPFSREYPQSVQNFIFWLLVWTVPQNRSLVVLVICVGSLVSHDWASDDSETTLTDYALKNFLFINFQDLQSKGER